MSLIFGRQARGPLINIATPRGRKSTQRERLLAGVIAVANRDGYAGATVSAVIAQAGVSRPTFYEYFADRDACFLATLAATSERLLESIRGAVRRAPPQQATTAAIAALIDFAGSQPALARFLLNEPLAAGRRALDARDGQLREIERIIQDVSGGPDRCASGPDIPIPILFGATYRVLATHLRRGDRGLTRVQEDLTDWVTRYEQPGPQQRWRSLRPGPPPKAAPPPLEPTLREPAPLSPGRPRLAPEQVAETHRQRILLAVARLADGKGYDATTIAEIAKLAKVDARVFYGLFANKQEAFMSVHELGFQQLMAITAGAFFEGETWPERSWRAGLAFARFLETNPLIAHVGFIEAYAVGPRAVQRVEDSHMAFTMFLQEGYQFAPQADPPSQLALEAIVGAIFEIVYHEARGGRTAKLSGMTGHIVFLFLAPFLGPQETNKFIDGQLKGRRRRPNRLAGA
jgi:AcrR family transcriptional regulator